MWRTTCACGAGSVATCRSADAHAESVLAQYETTVRPMHQEFVEPAKAYADLVLLDGSLPLNGWDELLQRVRSELQARRTDLPM